MLNSRPSCGEHVTTTGELLDATIEQVAAILRRGLEQRLGRNSYRPPEGLGVNKNSDGSRGDWRYRAARNPNADPVVVQAMIRLPHGSGILIALVISALFWIAVLVPLVA